MTGLVSVNMIIENAISKKQIKYYKFEKFNDMKEIGEDGSGKFYRARMKNSNFILKSFFNFDDTTAKEIINEFKLRREINYANNLIRFYGDSEHQENFINLNGITRYDPVKRQYLLVMEYPDGGTLQVYLKRNFRALTWKDKYSLAYQLACSVLCLHNKGLMHHDLHSNSIYVHQNTLKLGDLGLLKRIDEGHNTTSSVSDIIPYIDPNVFNDQNNNKNQEKFKLNKKSDIYSIGILLWEISSGRPPFNSDDNPHDNSLAKKLSKGLRESVVPNTPPEYVKLYTECWSEEPDKRPSINQIVTRLKLMVQTNDNSLNTTSTTNNERIIMNVRRISASAKKITANTRRRITGNSDMKSHSIKINTERPKTITEGVTINMEKMESLSISSNELDIIDMNHLTISSINSDNSLMDNIINEIINYFVKIVNQGKTFDERETLFKNFIKEKNLTTKEIFDLIVYTQEDSNHMFLLGYFSLVGIEILKNQENAFELFSKSSKRGNILSHYYLGECYQHGFGTNKNNLLAFECYQDASSKNFAAGQTAMGYFYQNGIGVEENQRMAIHWYKKASINGNLIATYNLGICYKYGSGVSKDVEEAFKYFKKSADGEYLHGISMLAYCYNRGIGTVVDKRKSLELFQKAADLGSGSAQHHLAEMYMTGDGISINKDQAMYWYEKAAKNGYDKSQDILGLNSDLPNKDFHTISEGLTELINKICDLENETEGIKQEIVKYLSDNVISNVKEIFDWLLRNQNNSNNIFLLGYFYYTWLKIGTELNSAFKLFKIAAEQNHALAQFYVGKCYQYGYETTKDDNLAFDYYQKSANNDCVMGQIKLTYYYNNNIIGKKDKKLACYWYERAAELGNPMAAFKAGLCYYNRNGVNVNHSKAFEFFEKSANGENVDGIGILGYCYQMGIGTNVDKKKAFELYQKASYLGKDSAQYNLALMYEEGDGIIKDISKAIYWYKICTESGFQLAKDKLKMIIEGDYLIKISDEVINHYLKSSLNNDYERLESKNQRIIDHLLKYELTLNKFIEWLTDNQDNLNNVILLGYFNFAGIGINKNHDQAFKLFNQAAVENHILALYYVGICYWYGYGTNKDDELAFKHFQIVANQDHPSGQVNVGYFYENGIGIEKNEDIAVHWYKKSANKGNAVAIYNLGYCHLYGKGIEKNDIMAFKFFKKSAEKEYVYGITMLGNCYQNGIVTNVDKKKAFEFYQKAACLENDIAQYNLADMYLNEKSDINNAIYWFEKAAQNGCNEAQKRLKDLSIFRISYS